MIKFITDGEEVRRPTFGDVEEDQFFVSSTGMLFQKTHSDSANFIATDDGVPHSARCSFGRQENIERILPTVTKIEF